MTARKERLYIAMQSRRSGTIVIHAAGGVSDYATLCGQAADGDEDSDEVIDLPAKAKINCDACRQLFDIAKELTRADFDTGRK